MKQRPNIDCGNEKAEPAFNRMQKVKRRFYALRNGALAAQMRSGGVEYRINFGLNLPQIKDVAAEIKRAVDSDVEMVELAKELWANVNTRESRLLAPMLYPVEMLDEATAMQWLREAQTTEVADILCHTLLKKHPAALGMAEAVISDSASTELQVYSALRLLMNLLAAGRIEPARVMETIKSVDTEQSPILTRLKTALLDECSFLSND